jgi:hypothetical protein
MITGAIALYEEALREQAPTLVLRTPACTSSGNGCTRTARSSAQPWERRPPREGDGLPATRESLRSI